ncbi:hypothetical protein [Nonomuraea aurantiaca]|uniref:hypothetical protein n=1 Tax=Nonomuraea aurantiaca TaxID=2878562 RepID=UPI001CD95EC2|nr:hypothetical protein [Nonomuraea aurantiaca]MCA2223534.1 hypothetical protein [Nonomuraea aurantiaca]
MLVHIAGQVAWDENGITVNALNPGRIRSTGLSRHVTAPPASFEPDSSDGVTVKDIPQGAATSTLLAASSGVPRDDRQRGNSV